MNRDHQYLRFGLITGLILATALLIAACSGPAQQQTGADADAEQENQVALPIVKGSHEGGEDANNEAYPASEEMATKPTPRGSDLVATDPATVNLASGQLQLVEMFAFW